MNILLWVLQAGLAFYFFSGGAYKIVSFEEIASVPAVAALPSGVWAAIGSLEMLCAVLLIVPFVFKRMPNLTPLAAVVLAVESFALAVLYGRYSLELVSTNPLPYVVVGGLLAAFVAFGRYSLVPRT